MNKRIIAIAGALVLAAIGTFVLVNYVQGAEDRALEGEETVDVLVVDRLIAAGTPVSDINGSVRTERVPVKVQAVGGIADLTALEGTVATVDLFPGEQVVSTRFQPAAVFEEVTENAGKVDVPVGMLEVTVELSPDRALGGAVTPGDSVGVIASFKPFQVDNIEPEDTGALAQGIAEILLEANGADQQFLEFGASTSSTSHLIIHKALVTAVHERQRAGGSSQVTVEEGEEVEATRDPAPNANIFVTLALEIEDIEKLVFTAEHGTVWLARQTDEARDDGTTIQTRATVYE